ncbi:hypothetical protein [Paenibacillus thalictri]|uniref:Uncharacterized protein n=1 Tax=Paenibacillus thalictri TaxID=2527873 RepID=A0A4Q9DZE1_9BACL|nr:hypothetical protein [Paenibacillus thalictri]TBL81806.1 hypothetical protein EYB31_02100 [Paenibacillus thalictri]
MINVLEYIRSRRKPAGFTPTGETKLLYLDMMEKAFGAYDPVQLEARLPCTEHGRLDDLQAYSRITSILGVLIANGRYKELQPLWERMMDACCRQFPQTSGDQMVDFSVKEVMLAYEAMKEHVPEERSRSWLDELKKIDPERNYYYVIRAPEDERRMHNINIYNMAGEWLRERAGLTETTGYFSRHWPVQLRLFDANGMYMDPNCPILYDLATRCQIQLLLGFGYRGEFYPALDRLLQQGGLCTLLLQSAAFELPYGGRSNQYLFNEALIAANCEYEAVRYARLGDHATAGAFKRSARLAARSVRRWLELDPPRHIKNGFPPGSKFGTEFYGYYDKYMATLGSFIYIAFLFADDTIEEQPCPAETGGYVWETSPAFHKIVANAGGYSVQLDTKADPHYDATGFGRIHKAGVPTELALSGPCPGDPQYVLPDGVPAQSLAIGPGWIAQQGQVTYLAELSEELEHKLSSISQEEDRVEFKVRYTGEALHQGALIEHYVLDKNGVRYMAEREEAGPLFMRVPLFSSNGTHTSLVDITDIRDHADSSCEFSHQATVKIPRWVYKVEFDGEPLLDSTARGNRNGLYTVLELQGRSSLRIQLSLGEDTE